MNHLILSHQTALAAIRQYRLYLSFDEFLDSLQGSKEIHILISDSNKMSKSPVYKYHLNTLNIPNGSIKAINENVKIVSPQYLLVQLSNLLSYEELFLFVLELSGTYTINSTDKTFTNNLKPLINIKTLTKYIERFKNMNYAAKGLNKLMGICKYAQNGSASPMESRLFIKLCAPKNKGFYGCKNLKLNQPVRLSKKARLIAGQECIVPDISCQNKKVAIEYDSAQFHENSTQGQRDKRRRDALVYDG